MLLKIAVASHDGTAMTPDFRKTTHYLLFDAEDGAILDEETRTVENGDVMKPLEDCHILLSGGMEIPDFQAVQQLGLRPFVMGFDGPPRQIVEMLIAGRLRLQGSCDCPDHH